MERKVKKHSNRKVLSFYADVIAESIFLFILVPDTLNTEILCRRKNKINMCGKMNKNPQGLVVITKDKIDYLCIFGTTSLGPQIPTAKYGFSPFKRHTETL